MHFKYFQIYVITTYEESFITYSSFLPDHKNIHQHL